MAEDERRLAEALQSAGERAARCPLCLRRSALGGAPGLQRLLRHVPPADKPRVMAACAQCESGGRAALRVLAALARAGRLQRCLKSVSSAKPVPASLRQLSESLVEEVVRERPPRYTTTETLHVDIPPDPAKGQVLLPPLLVVAPPASAPSLLCAPLAPRAKQPALTGGSLASGAKLKVSSAPFPPTPRIVAVRGRSASPESVLPDLEPPPEERGEECVKQPLANGARVDWEDKIPMDVISFMDATDPNASSLLQTQQNRRAPARAPARSGALAPAEVACVIDLR